MCLLILQDPVQRDTELLQVQERCLLLALAAQWLCQHNPPALERLAELEKRQWEWRIRRMVLTTALEQQSLFTPAPGPDAFDGLLKEYSFSKMAVLDDQAYLNIEGLPMTEAGCLLEEEEQKALSTFIGQLLDEGSVHEASRVCRYFELLHRDVWLVLQCRGLACGEIQPGLPELLSSDQESRRSLPSCKDIVFKLSLKCGCCVDLKCSASLKLKLCVVAWEKLSAARFWNTAKSFLRSAP